ncbi:MAG: RNA polymerase sigma factor [Streptosporangiaceae bacterium]|jgi:RNA polymerase sigma-70 factor (ECF subfamily)
MSAEDLSDVVGDPAAFEDFYRRHVTAISRFLARRVTDPQLVADLTADVFHEVIRSAHTYRRDRGSELGWLYGIARNVLAYDRRREASRLRAERVAAGRRLLDEDDIARLEERIDAESAARRLRQALSLLPENDRALVELVAVDGLSLKDAAAALGIKSGTARVRMYRARRATRDALEPPLPQSPAAVPSLSTGIREN